MSEEIALPFHRKYRSRNLTEYVGNDKMISDLKDALKKTNRPQVMLYQGPAGCGKTTFARLTAREYLCLNRDPEKGACGECENCRNMVNYIETGDSDGIFSLNEVDVTDSNKREDIDRLLEEAQNSFFLDEWKIFILDECHMLTVTAQNRLLKTLEEPKDKVLFLLCTTDPEKLLETIITRCQYVWEVKKPTREEIVPLLQRICKAEGALYEAKGLSLVCVKGNFVPRKVLVKLEQVIKSRNQVMYQDVVEVLQAMSDDIFIKFYEILLAPYIDPTRFITFLGKLKMEHNFKEFLDNLVEFTKRGIYVANGVTVEALDTMEVTTFKKLFGNFTPASIAALLSKLISMQRVRNIETELMLLAYTGLQTDLPASGDAKNTDVLAPVTEKDKEKENKEADRNHQDRITLSPEDIADVVKNSTRSTSITDLASKFGGTVVTLPQTE